MLALASWMAAGAADYNIVEFGAKSDTTVLSTLAVQQAIDRCSAAGGGRVVVPAGMYKTGSIELRSHVELHLEAGATLYGSTRLEDYREQRTDYVSLRTWGPTIQLIFADGNPAGIKCLMSHMGLCENVLRLPLVTVNGKVEDDLIEEWKQLKDK